VDAPAANATVSATTATATAATAAGSALVAQATSFGYVGVYSPLYYSNTSTPSRSNKPFAAFSPSHPSPSLLPTPHLCPTSPCHRHMNNHSPSTNLSSISSCAYSSSASSSQLSSRAVDRPRADQEHAHWLTYLPAAHVMTVLTRSGKHWAVTGAYFSLEPSVGGGCRRRANVLHD